MSGTLFAARRATFRAFACTVVPEMIALDEPGWAEVEHTIEHALSLRPPKLRRQLAVLLRTLDVLARMRSGRGFSQLDDAARTRFVDALQHSPVQLLRRGVWGLRTLVFMGYYTRDATMQVVGYRAHPRGWEAR